MGDLHAKILTALRPLGEVVDWLDDIPQTGRVMGVLVSPAFDDLDHKDRQKKLWSLLDAALTPSETRLIGPIATLTPSEATLKAG